MSLALIILTGLASLPTRDLFFFCPIYKEGGEKKWGWQFQDSLWWLTEQGAPWTRTY